MNILQVREATPQRGPTRCKWSKSRRTYWFTKVADCWHLVVIYVILSISKWLFIKLYIKSLISRCKNLMNQVVWFDNLCLFTMCGWFYRCGSRMYDEDVEVQLVTYGTRLLTLVCSVWDSVQIIYTACFLPCSCVFLPTDQMHTGPKLCLCMWCVCFLFQGIWISDHTDNSVCPHYNIRMLEIYLVSGIPFENGPFNSWVFFGRTPKKKFQPAPDEANRPGVINRKHQRPRSRNRRRHGISLLRWLWIPDFDGMILEKIYCTFPGCFATRVVGIFFSQGLTHFDDVFCCFGYILVLGSKESLHAVISCSVDGTVGLDER